MPSWPAAERTRTPRTPRTPRDERTSLETWLEYARHNGHADLLRERIDGVTDE
jgi:hypothetical protein